MENDSACFCSTHNNNNNPKKPHHHPRQQSVLMSSPPHSNVSLLLYETNFFPLSEAIQAQYKKYANKCKRHL